MGEVVGPAVGIDQHPGQQGGRDGHHADDHQGERPRAPAALHQIDAPVGERPVDGEGDEQGLQQGGRRLGDQPREPPASGDQVAPGLLQAELDDQQNEQPGRKPPAVGEQCVAQHHDQARRQVARKVQRRGPGADVDAEGWRHPVAVFLMREHDAADRAEGDQGDELGAAQAWRAAQHAHAQQHGADDGRHVDRQEDQGCAQAGSRGTTKRPWPAPQLTSQGSGRATGPHEKGGCIAAAALIRSAKGRALTRPPAPPRPAWTTGPRRFPGRPPSSKAGFCRDRRSPGA